MRVVLCPPLAHHPAGHTACQTLPFLCAPPTYVHPQCATPGDTGHPGHQNDLSEREVRFGAVSPLPCLPCPLSRLPVDTAAAAVSERGHTASSHSCNRIRELWSTGVN